MRRYYRLLSWDYITNRGIATDGTSWEGEFIAFDVYGTDLAPEYHGFLNNGEVFSAVESPSRILYDVVIERGPRAARPSQTVPQAPLDDNAVEQIVDRGLTVEGQIDQYGTDDFTGRMIAGDEQPMGGPNAENFSPSYATPLRLLEDRVKRLEGIINNRMDDHR